MKAAQGREGFSRQRRHLNICLEMETHSGGCKLFSVAGTEDRQRGRRRAVIQGFGRINLDFILMEMGSH